jgi:hypothetical protein
MPGLGLALQAEVKRPPEHYDALQFVASMVMQFLSFAGRGYSATGTSTSLRRVGVSVGTLLAGSAMIYGGHIAFNKEGSPTFFPAVQAAVHAHQPSVSIYTPTITPSSSVHCMSYSQNVASPVSAKSPLNQPLNGHPPCCGSLNSIPLRLCII